MKSSSGQRFPFDESERQKPTRQSHFTDAERGAHSRRKVLLLLLVAALVLGIGIPAVGSGLWKNILGSLTDPTATKVSQTASGTSAIGSGASETTAAATPTPSPSPAPTPIPVTRITLAGVGDIILHQAVIDGGLTTAGSTPAVYDYRPIFQYIKPILQASDLAVANYEGTLAGAPYSGYPFFCAPDAIADALADAGFRTVWTANNHTIDKGLKGVIRTAAVFREKGFRVIGTRPDETTPADAVADVSGIKIGLMAYTFETTGTATQKALNGIAMPAAADPLIDSFNPYRPDAYIRDIQALLERAAILRQQGAEMICLSMHWGDEYKTRSNTYQRKLAQQLADAGIELIIGHHPHVLEEIEVLTSAKTGKPTLVFYSIGNFLHNMDFNTHNTAGNAQDAVVARIRICKDHSGVRIESAEYIPTYVVRVAKGNGIQHLIVPVLPGLADPSAYQTTAREMAAARDRIAAVLGDSKGSTGLPVVQAAK